MRASSTTALAAASLLVLTACGGSTAAPEEETPLAAPPSTAPTAPPLDEVAPAPVDGPRVSGTGYVASLPADALVTSSPSWDYSVVVGSTTTELRTLDGALPEDVFETVDGVVAALSASPYEGATRVAVEWDGVSDTYLVSALDTSTDAYVVELVAAFGDDLVEVRASTEGPEGDEPFSYPDLSVLRSVAAG